MSVIKTKLRSTAMRNYAQQTIESLKICCHLLLIVFWRGKSTSVQNTLNYRKKLKKNVRTMNPTIKVGGPNANHNHQTEPRRERRE